MIEKLKCPDISKTTLKKGTSSDWQLLQSVHLELSISTNYLFSSLKYVSILVLWVVMLWVSR
jgi:hypothetical protein